MEQQVDANKVLQRLSNKLAEAHLTISVLETQLEMQDDNTETENDSNL